MVPVAIGSHVRNTFLDVLSAVVFALICACSHSSFNSELLTDTRAARILLIAIASKCVWTSIGYSIRINRIVIAIVLVGDLITNRVILIEYSAEDRIGLLGAGVMIETVHERTIGREVAIKHHLD